MNMYFQGSHMGGGKERPESSAASAISDGTERKINLAKNRLDYNAYEKREGCLEKPDYKVVVEIARDLYRNKKTTGEPGANGEGGTGQLLKKLNLIEKRADLEFFNRRDQLPYMYDALDEALRKNPQFGDRYSKKGKLLTDQQLLIEAMKILGGEDSLEDIADIKGAYKPRTVR